MGELSCCNWCGRGSRKQDGLASSAQQHCMKAPPLIRPLQIQVYACVMSKSLRNRGPNTKIKCEQTAAIPSFVYWTVFGCLDFLSSFFSPVNLLPVWQNGGDRQHPKPWLCSKVHPGLLFWGEAEPSLWLVSDLLWSCIIIVASLVSSALLHCDVLYLCDLQPCNCTLKKLTSVNPANSVRSNIP